MLLGVLTTASANPQGCMDRTPALLTILRTRGEVEELLGNTYSEGDEFILKVNLKLHGPSQLFML